MTDIEILFVYVFIVVYTLIGYSIGYRNGYEDGRKEILKSLDFEKRKNDESNKSD